MKGLLCNGDLGMQPDTVCWLSGEFLVGISPLDKKAL